LQFKASLGKKLAIPHLIKVVMMVHISYPRYMGGLNRRIEVQTSLGKNSNKNKKPPKKQGLGMWLKA
jgi:hypothetical protein